MKLIDPASKRQFDVELERRGAVIEATIDGVRVSIEHTPLADGSSLVELNGQHLRVFAARLGESILVSVGPRTFEFTIQQPGRAAVRHSLATPLLTAPMPGKVLKIMVAEGDRVEVGQPLIVLEAMKMETTLIAEGPAQVKKIPVAAGQMVDAGAVLMELSPAASQASQSPS